MGVSTLGGKRYFITELRRTTPRPKSSRVAASKDRRWCLWPKTWGALFSNQGYTYISTKVPTVAPVTAYAMDQAAARASSCNMLLILFFLCVGSLPRTKENASAKLISQTSGGTYLSPSSCELSGAPHASDSYNSYSIHFYKCRRYACILCGVASQEGTGCSFFPCIQTRRVRQSRDYAGYRRTAATSLARPYYWADCVPVPYREGWAV